MDLNGDGDETDEDEGFFRVYQSDDYRMGVGEASPRQSLLHATWWGGTTCSTSHDIRGSENCGDYHNPGQYLCLGRRPRSGRPRP